MKFLLVILALVSSSVFAQDMNSQRLMRLERVVQGLEQRVRYLESMIQAPAPIPVSYWSCSIRDTMDGRVHIGQDASREVAKAQAINNCQKNFFNSGYCPARNVTCEETYQ
jgi:hypothetical protein